MFPEFQRHVYKWTKTSNMQVHIWYWLSTIHHHDQLMTNNLFLLAHLTQRVRVMWVIVTTERPSSVVRPLTFHILINFSEATGPI
jgi:hypothetical protein